MIGMCKAVEIRECVRDAMLLLACGALCRLRAPAKLCIGVLRRVLPVAQRIRPSPSLNTRKLCIVCSYALCIAMHCGQQRTFNGLQ